MKTIFKFIIPFFLLTPIACDDINSLHEEYLDWGEIIYTGAVDSLKAYPGDNRVKLTWEIGLDPRITKVVIYWDSRLDSVVIPVNRTQPERMEMEHLINIPEGGYLFEVATKDDEGHQSMYTEKSVDVYGTKYAALLRNRMVSSMAYTSDTELKITWSKVEYATTQYTTVRYNGKTIKVENDDTTTLLTVTPGETFEVYSNHLPVGGLDTIDALPKVYKMP